MLKSEVCVNGLVTRSAVAKTNSEGKPFVSFGIRVNVPDRQGAGCMLDISVSCDGEDTTGLVTNARVEIKGTMTFKKRGERVYLNLHASEVSLNPPSTTDMISGTLSMRGTIGKNVDAKNDKNGKPYMLFSAYSAEKVDDTFEYTWVRFVSFGENDAIKPQSKIEVSGELELSCYEGRLNISCRARDIKEWVKQPQQADGQNPLP